MMPLTRHGSCQRHELSLTRYRSVTGIIIKVYMLVCSQSFWLSRSQPRPPKRINDKNSPTKFARGLYTFRYG